MIIEELLFEEESSILDFKQQQYPFANENDYKKSELLKDILAFANAWRRNDAYILIGIEEVKGARSNVLGIDNDLDDSDLQQFVNSKTQRPLIFEYKNTKVDNKNIGLIKIPINERPIYLKKDYGKLKKDIVYIRRGSSTGKASPDEIAKMGASTQSEKNIAVLELSFANRNEKLNLDTNINIISKILELPDNIKDYEENRSYNKFDFMPRSYSNKDYYRELCNYYYLKTIANPLAFCIKNLSDTTAIDIKIEVNVSSYDNNLNFILEKKLLKKPRASYDNGIHDIKSFKEQMSEIQVEPDIVINLINKIWHIDIYFKKVQPRQTIFTKDLIYLILKKEEEINFDYKIFADELPTPIEGNLTINGRINKQKNTLEEILDIEYEEFLELHPIE